MTAAAVRTPSRSLLLTVSDEAADLRPPMVCWSTYRAQPDTRNIPSRYRRELSKQAVHAFKTIAVTGSSETVRLRSLCAVSSSYRVCARTILDIGSLHGAPDKSATYGRVKVLGGDQTIVRPQKSLGVGFSGSYRAPLGTYLSKESRFSARLGLAGPP